MPTKPSFLATPRGKLTLFLLCAVAFIDFVDASIVNIALPSIRRALHFSEPDLQRVPSAYLLTYGGFMLLGGRAADLLGRRRVLISGTVLIGVSSLIGGLAGSSGVLVGARMAQGLGAAMMLPAALSILTTTFAEGRDRNTALGAWGGVGGLASAAGVLLGGAVLASAGMLLLVYALVQAPTVGWDTARTIIEIAAALALLATFVVNEMRRPNPLAPLRIFAINGLGFADATQLMAFGGFIAMFFFLTLYMQNVLHFSPIQTGTAYLPLCFATGIAAGVASQLVARIGTRPLIVGGALTTAGGIFWLSRIPVYGSFTADLLPGMLVVACGLGPVFVAVTTAANAGVPADQAGLAASLVNASQQLGAALGLAIFTALATSYTAHLLAAHVDPASALTRGFARGLAACAAFLAIAAVLGLRATNTGGETPDTRVPEPVAVGA